MKRDSDLQEREHELLLQLLVLWKRRPPVFSDANLR